MPFSEELQQAMAEFIRRYLDDDPPDPDGCQCEHCIRARALLKRIDSESKEGEGA